MDRGGALCCLTAFAVSVCRGGNQRVGPSLGAISVPFIQTPLRHFLVFSDPLKVIEMMDKTGGFDENDEKLVGMLAAHMGAFMRQLDEGNKVHEYEEAQPVHTLCGSRS